MQYRTANSLCRKCHRPLDIEEPVHLAPQLVASPSVPSSAEAGLQVAGQVREIRKARHLSQRQLAGRMMVPRTYISKIENGKAIPTLGSLERLANALEVDVCQLVRDSRSRRDEEVATILADPFLAEVATLLPQLEQLQRTLFLSAVRDAATGRRRPASRALRRPADGLCHLRSGRHRQDVSNVRSLRPPLSAPAFHSRIPCRPCAIAAHGRFLLGSSMLLRSCGFRGVSRRTEIHWEQSALDPVRA